MGWVSAEGAQALAADLAKASEAKQAACESIVGEAGKLSQQVEMALDTVVAFRAKVCTAPLLVYYSLLQYALCFVHK